MTIISIPIAGYPLMMTNMDSLVCTPGPQFQKWVPTIHDQRHTLVPKIHIIKKIHICKWQTLTLRGMSAKVNCVNTNRTLCGFHVQNIGKSVGDVVFHPLLYTFRSSGILGNFLPFATIESSPSRGWKAVRAGLVWRRENNGREDSRSIAESRAHGDVGTQGEVWWRMDWLSCKKKNIVRNLNLEEKPEM